MRLKHSLPIFGLVAMLGLGVGAGLLSTKTTIRESEATAGDKWCYKGSTYWMNNASGVAVETKRGATEWEWEEGDPYLLEGTSEVWTFGNYEKFFFTHDATNIGQTVLGGTASSNFSADGDLNIQCTVPGAYKITIESSTSIKIDYPSKEDVVSTGKVYRFTRPSTDWGETIYAFPFGSTSFINNPQWGKKFQLRDYSYNENSERVYYFYTNVTNYTGIIFTDGSHQTHDITISTNTAWYCTGTVSEGKYEVATWIPGNNSYYFYDYLNHFDYDLHVYAWSSNASMAANAVYASAPKINGANNSSGQLYWFELPCEYDYVIFKNEDNSIHSGDTAIHTFKNSCYAAWSWNAVDGEGKTTINSFTKETYFKAFAHDWCNNILALRYYDTALDDSAGTNWCLTRYDLAKTSYQAYDNAVRTAIAAEDNYASAYARFQKWAIANHETIEISDDGEGHYSIDVKTAKVLTMPIGVAEGSESNIILIIIAASSIAVLALIGGYFYFRKRKEDR